MGWMLAALPLALLLLGFPIFLLLLATDAAAVLLFLPTPATVIHQLFFGSMDKVALLAVPFFIFAGEMMSRGGVSRRLLNWVTSVVGARRGSAPLTALTTATIFGAISGSTVATVAAVGTITHAQMRERGYSDGFASALLASAGSISNLIPPSIAMIVYGFATQTSIVKLFAAGILPGIVLSLFFGVYVVIHAMRLDTLKITPLPRGAFLKATRESLLAFGAPVIILGGIYTGVFSPTEAAGVACLYGVLVTLLAYRDSTLRTVIEVASNSAYLTAQIFVVIAASGVFSWLLTVSGSANAAVAYIEGLALPQWALLLVINLFLLIVGCLLDPASATIVLSPVLASIATASGVDPVHFGIIVVMNLSIGTFTPPFGLDIFTVQALFRTPLSALYPALLPFIAMAIAALMVVTYMPWLSLWILRFL